MTVGFDVFLYRVIFAMQRSSNPVANLPYASNYGQSANCPRWLKYEVTGRQGRIDGS